MQTLPLKTKQNYVPCLGLVQATAVSQLGYGSGSSLIQVLVHPQAHSTLTVCVSVAYQLISNVCTDGTLFFGGKSTLQSNNGLANSIFGNRHYIHSIQVLVWET